MRCYPTNPLTEKQFAVIFSVTSSVFLFVTSSVFLFVMHHKLEPDTVLNISQAYAGNVSA